MTDSTVETTAYRFRTAVGGFHKGDVTEYITKISTQHRDELKECRDRITALEQENDSLRQLIITTPLPEEGIQAEVPSLDQDDTISDLELQAYRRAEAAERMALQRAKRLYEGLDEICKNTRSEFDTANAAMKATVTTVMAQARALEEAYEALSQVLTHSQEQLSSMDAMLPDPGEDLETETCL